MINLRQKELADWQEKNFGSKTKSSEWQFMGMVEEMGELGHALLKKKQGIRNMTHEDVADAFADTIIYGIQIMTAEGIDAEKAIKDTIDKVLQRDWIKYPSNGIDK